MHAGRKQRHVIGKILCNLAVRTEAGDESAVVPLAQGVLQERGRGSLLELESAAHRSAGINQQAHMQG